MSPGDSATAYLKYVQPYAGQAKLGAPAVTNSATNGQGLSWLGEFLKACNTCTIDFVAIHWYNPNGDVSDFKKHVQAAHDQTGKNVWVTEVCPT